MLLLALLVQTACTVKPDVYKTADESLLIQVKQVDAENDDNDHTFRVQIVLAKPVLDTFQVANRQSFLFRMDECFWLETAGKTALPVLVQSVGMSAAGHYDYLVVFPDPRTSVEKTRFIYQDRYVTRRKYSIELSLAAN